jgi:hypothetical protein
MTLAEYRTRCRLAESCLPPAEYRTLLTRLHDDMLGVIAMDEALLKQALEALEMLTECYDDSAVGLEIDAIKALKERLK